MTDHLLVPQHAVLSLLALRPKPDAKLDEREEQTDTHRIF